MTPARPPHKPRVSVAMVTYRHENWLAQALESVLEQDLDDWEIVLADDASDDRTIDVARAYLPACEGPHGQRLRLLEHRRKIGPRRNYMRTLRACRGTYTSQLDGDDWFIDPTKLSKQAAFLDENQDCSGVFGAWLETDVMGLNPKLQNGFGLGGRSRFSASDFGPFCRTTSVAVLFRTGLFGDFPHWYESAEVGDWPLHVLNMFHGGDYAFVPDIVAAHRRHSGGVWSGRSDLEQIESTLRTQDQFLSVLPPELAKEMLPKMLQVNAVRAREHRGKGQPEVAVPLERWNTARS